MKLKHYDAIAGNADIHEIIADIYGFKKKGLFQGFRFMRIVKVATKDILKISEDIKNIDKIDCGYGDLIYSDVNYLPYISRMSLENHVRNSKMSTGEDIAKLIALATYNSTTGAKGLDMDSWHFKLYIGKVRNQPILPMYKLFAKVLKDITASIDFWDKEFNNVYVTDPDWLQAGGKMLDRFYITSVIKATCASYNVSYQDAWEMSYIAVQTNLLLSSTSSYVQEALTKVKEMKLRAKGNGGK